MVLCDTTWQLSPPPWGGRAAPVLCCLWEVAPWIGGQLCWDLLLSWFYLLCPVPFGWTVPKSKQIPRRGGCTPSALGAGAPGLWWCLSHEHRWRGEVLVLGVGSALHRRQSFFLFPTQGRAMELLTGKRMGRERTRDKDLCPSSSPRSAVSSPQLSLCPRWTSLGLGDLPLPPASVGREKGDALKCTPVNKPFCRVARQRRASPVELERVPVKRLRSVFQADKSLPLKCGGRAEAPSSRSCCQPLRVNHSPVQIRVQSVAEHFSCPEEGSAGDRLGPRMGA